MPANEFEKKVSSEMQDLRLKPSEKVWQQVEERIKKKKKRRVFVILFFLAGLALLGYWQRHNLFGGNETGVAKIDTAINAETINSTEPNKTPPNKPENQSSTQTTAESGENKIIAPDDIQTRNTKESLHIKTRKTSAPTTDYANNRKRLPVSDKEKNKPVAEKKPTDETASLLVTQTDPRVNPKEAKDSIEIKTAEPGLKKEQPKVVEPVVDNKIDSAAIVVDKKREEGTKTDTITAKEPLTDSAAAVVQIQAVSKKWQWGIEFTPGISSLNDEFFSLNMNKSFMDAYGGPQSGSGAPLPPAPPSESASSFAFQIGGFAKKQLSKKSSFSIGLRYGYYSDRIQVGRDSVLLATGNVFSNNANSFYQASNSFREKTNSYHFVEIPLNYHLRLNKNNQKPFEWSIGVTLSRLIASNALMYDTSFRGIYYKNNELLNKTQFSLSTGLSFTIMNRKYFRWSAGAVADLHLNSLYDNPLDSRKYLFFAGLRSAILFNKKK